MGGTNNYRYAPNPVGWVDPFGLTSVKEDSNRQILAIAAPKWSTPEMPGKAITSWMTTEDIILEQAIDASYQISKIDGSVKPGGFFTDADSISSSQYVRNDLAVTHEMKSQVTHVVKFKIPAGVRLQQSTVNPQTDVDGTYLPGGKQQYEILNYEDRKKIEAIETRPIA